MFGRLSKEGDLSCPGSAWARTAREALPRSPCNPSGSAGMLVKRGGAAKTVRAQAEPGHEKGSLTTQQIFGNWLATRLIKILWNFNYSDLGPFRAIRAKSLRKLEMRDNNFGWTVEMQIKALKHKLRIEEVPVRYRKRRGQSKVSGTLSGSIKAGFKILYLIAKFAFQQ